MNNADAAEPSKFEGNMFLYEQPELLSKEDHGNLGLSKMERPHDFARDIKGVPLVVGELQSAQKYYPVVFTDFETPVLIAIVGIIEDHNLFVDETGHWEMNTYVPSYLRCHPFALARRPGDEYAVVFDRSSQEVSESPEMPFFDGDDMSEGMQARVDFCTQYNAERQRTNDFCRRVKELGLLNGQRVTQTMSDGEEVKIADYVTVDSRKLTELDQDVLQELHKDGSLSAIYAQLFSIENWNRLIAKRVTLRGES